jgi:hypothetical protein
MNKNEGMGMAGEVVRRDLNRERSSIFRPQTLQPQLAAMSHEGTLQMGGNSLDLVAGAEALEAKAAASLLLTNCVLAGMDSSHVETFRF